MWGKMVKILWEWATSVDFNVFWKNSLCISLYACLWERWTNVLHISWKTNITYVISRRWQIHCVCQRDLPVLSSSKQPSSPQQTIHTILFVTLCITSFHHLNISATTRHFIPSLICKKPTKLTFLVRCLPSCHHFYCHY